MADAFETKYDNALTLLLKRTEGKSANGEFAALGFTSNLDLLCDFEPDELNRLIETNLHDVSRDDIRPASIIKTMKDLLLTISFFCINGIGGEVDIQNTEDLKKSFRFKYGMGGTATQAALALSEVGGRTLVHLTDDSPEVCEILNKAHIYTVDKGELVHSDRLIQKNEQEMHFIIQFMKGGSVKIAGKEYQIPASNRLILTKTTVNETVPMNPDYFTWIENHAERVSSNVVSSFNCIINEEILMQRIRFVKSHIEKYHLKNKNGIVYYEDAHYHDKKIRKSVLEELCPVVDIMGMNEEELAYTLHEMYGIQSDDDDIISYIEGALELMNRLSVRKGVVIHTKDYSMYVGKKTDADIESGLMFGNILATAKAANGWYGTKEQIKEILKNEMSSKGLLFRKQVLNSRYASEVTLVPTRYIEKPKYTIGLGDAFVGGLQMCF